jgi:YidC/Oxa1 family membrane protein insertase
MPIEQNESPLQPRMILAFLLVFAVIFATPYFYKLISPPVPEKPAQTASKPAASAPSKAPATASTPTAPDVPVPAVASAREFFVIDTDFYHIVFSNEGATVRSWTLKQYKDGNGKPLELINPTALDKVGNAFAYTFREKHPSVDLTKALFVTKPNPNGLSIDFEFSDGKVFARKTFDFKKSSYLSTVTSEVTENGAPLLALMQWRGGFGDMAALSANNQQDELRYDNNESKIYRDNAKVAKDGPRNTDGAFSYVGLEDQYFTAVFLPSGNGLIQSTIFDDLVATPYEKEEEPYVGAAVGGAGRATYSLFVGPKDIDTLRAVNPKLEQIVDWGTFGIVAKPLFLILHWANDRYVHNYGWAIVLVTIAINMLLFPLKMQNMKSMKKMQALQPQIAIINEKYKNIPLRDPRQQQKNEETMALYKANGANPLGGCLPLLIQMPFLLAFYKVLAVSIEMRNASWFWVHDLSQPETFAIRILPLLMIASGFVMQKMTPVPSGGDPAQAKMMQFMPLMMGFFFWKASSGLVLYWLTGNLVGIAQQWFFNKTMTPADIGRTIVTTSGKNPRSRK